jgi:transposase-like protein
MTNRRSAAVAAAVRMVARGARLTDAARKHGVAVSSVRRAARDQGLNPRPGGRPRKEK